MKKGNQYIGDPITVGNVNAEGSIDDTVHVSTFTNNGTASEIGRMSDGVYTKVADFDTTTFTNGGGPIRHVIGNGHFLVISNQSRLLMYNTYTNQLVSGIEFDNVVKGIEFTDDSKYLYIVTTTTATRKTKSMTLLTIVTTESGSGVTYRVDTLLPYSVLTAIQKGDVASNHAVLKHTLRLHHNTGYHINFEPQHLGRHATCGSYAIEQTISGLMLYSKTYEEGGVSDTTQCETVNAFIDNPNLKWFDLTPSHVVYATDASFFTVPYSVETTDDGAKFVLGEVTEVRFGDCMLGIIVSMSVCKVTTTVYLTGLHLQGDYGECTQATVSWHPDRAAQVHIHKPITFTRAVNDTIWVGGLDDGTTLVGKAGEGVIHSTTNNVYLSKSLHYIKDINVVDSGCSVVLGHNDDHVILVQRIVDGSGEGFVWVSCDSMGVLTDVSDTEGVWGNDPPHR